MFSWFYYQIDSILNFFKLYSIIFLKSKKDRLFWLKMIKNRSFSNYFINKHFFDVYQFICYKDTILDDCILERVIKNDNFSIKNQILILKYHNISEHLLQKYESRFDLNLVFLLRRNLSESYFIENYDKLNWSLISLKQNLSNSFITSNIDKINWYLIVNNENYKLDIIIRYLSQINKKAVSRFVLLHPKILMLLEETVDWSVISSTRIIAEVILISFKDKINFDLLKKNDSHNKSVKYYSKECIFQVKPSLNEYFTYITHCKKIQRIWRNICEQKSKNILKK